MEPAKPLTYEQIEQELRDLRTKMAKVERDVWLMKQSQEIAQASRPPAARQAVPPPLPTEVRDFASVFPQMPQPIHPRTSAPVPAAPQPMQPAATSQADKAMNAWVAEHVMNVATVATPIDGNLRMRTGEHDEKRLQSQGYSGQ